MVALIPMMSSMWIIAIASSLSLFVTSLSVYSVWKYHQPYNVLIGIGFGFALVINGCVTLNRTGYLNELIVGSVVLAIT